MNFSVTGMIGRLPVITLLTYNGLLRVGLSSDPERADGAALGSGCSGVRRPLGAGGSAFAAPALFEKLARVVLRRQAPLALPRAVRCAPRRSSGVPQPEPPGEAHLHRAQRCGAAADERADGRATAALAAATKVRPARPT